jgi:hypothetical protein
MADFGTASQTAVEAAQAALASETAARTASTTATNKASEATTAATTATTKAGEASTSASTATSAKDTAVSASQTATTKATEATSAAATAVSAKDDAVSANTAAQSAKTAAQTAQTGAETAAASVQSSAAQIATNAEDIAQLMSDLTTFTGNAEIPMVSGKYITLSRATVDMSGGVPQYSGNADSYQCGMMRCTAGDVFCISGTGGVSGRLWGFVDASGNILSVADATITADKWLIPAPINSAWIIINDKTAQTSYKGQLIHDTVEDLNEDIQSAKTALGVSERYKAITFPTDFFIVGKCVNGNTVGNTITFATSAYRSVIRAEIPKGCEACHIIYAVDSSESICAVITDANDTVVKTISGSYTNQTYKKVYVADVDAKYIYWTAYSSRPTHILFEYDKYQIYEGEKVALTNNGLTETGETIKGENAIKFSLSSSSATTGDLTFAECGDFTIGLWLKMPVYDQVKNTNRITIDFYNSGDTLIRTISLKANCLQNGEWTFVKTPFTNASQYRLATKAVITLSFASGYTDTVTLLISPFVVVNNFSKAVYIFNQDSFWGASEDCGFYQYLIDNKIPWTVTGVNNSTDPVSDAMTATLKQAYIDGLLDIGIYTNEQPTEHPIANNATSFIAVQDAMNHLIDTKIEQGFYPISIGCGTNLMPPAIKKSIDFSGFKAIRGGTTGGSNAMGESIDKRIIFISADISSKSSGGGYCMSMYHGVSTDPSSEHDPSLYVSWSSVKSLIDALITARNNHEVLLMNMKQFAEFVQK